MCFNIPRVSPLRHSFIFSSFPWLCSHISSSRRTPESLLTLHRAGRASVWDGIYRPTWGKTASSQYWAFRPMTHGPSFHPKACFSLPAGRWCVCELVGPAQHPCPLEPPFLRRETFPVALLPPKWELVDESSPLASDRLTVQTRPTGPS